MVNLNNKNGFSLVEMLVSVSVFAVIAFIASSMFGVFANNQKKTQTSQELLNNTQYALEIISREVKNNEIISFGTGRAPCSNLPVEYTQCLLFARENGETAGFVYNATNNELAYTLIDCTRSDSTYSDCHITAGQTPTALLSKDSNNVEITSLHFLLTPSVNPYFYEDNSPENHQQPKVTINLAVKYNSLKAFEQSHYYLQTTVSSRIYKR